MKKPSSILSKSKREISKHLLFEWTQSTQKRDKGGSIDKLDINQISPP